MAPLSGQTQVDTKTNYQVISVLLSLLKVYEKPLYKKVY